MSGPTRRRRRTDPVAPVGSRSGVENVVITAVRSVTVAAASLVELAGLSG
ncbi:hypothetical protein NJ7G_3445 [Natrinema sp. J7-2]|nr:hypothetical protein NJ7G_3445 [Natrinema sp. J7-2]